MVDTVGILSLHSSPLVLQCSDDVDVKSTSNVEVQSLDLSCTPASRAELLERIPSAVGEHHQQ